MHIENFYVINLNLTKFEPETLLKFNQLYNRSCGDEIL